MEHNILYVEAGTSEVYTVIPTQYFGRDMLGMFILNASIWMLLSWGKYIEDIVVVRAIGLDSYWIQTDVSIPLRRTSVDTTVQYWSKDIISTTVTKWFDFFLGG